jgi:hypothetical protein
MSALQRLAPLLALAACAAPGPPPVAVETPFGTVRGETEEVANRVAAEVEILAPQVRATLVDAREELAEVWVLETLRDARGRRTPSSVSGFTRYRDRAPIGIHLREEADPRWALAHELVHALCGPTWDALPGVMHEGLADVVAEELVPEVAAEVRATRILNASLFVGGLSITVRWDERGGRRSTELWVPFAEPGRRAQATAILALDRWVLHEESEIVPEALYGMGWLITRRAVDRGGVEGLRSLCVAARADGRSLVAADELLSAAGMHLGDWAEAVAAELGREEVHEIAQLLPNLFPSVAAELFEQQLRARSPESLFSELRPRIVVAGGEVSLASLPGVRKRLERRAGS